MAIKIFTSDELSKLFGGKVKHKAYADTVDMAYSIRIHADGFFPGCLIEERRPSESEAVFKYRKQIWKPITQQTFSKVITELMKIRRSADWSIRFDNTVIPAVIREDETLEDYITQNYPSYTSITNWAFAVLLRAYAIDANALVTVMPLSFEVPENEYLQPVATIFNSEQVAEYVEGSHAVVKSTDKVLFIEDDVEVWGDIWYVFTTYSVARYEQFKRDGSMRLAAENMHNLGILPIVKTKGLVKHELEGTTIFKSRLADMTPRLDEAVREYSDLQAGIVGHNYPEKWEIVDDECKVCKGKKELDTAYGGCQPCYACGGTGHPVRGPYTTIQVKMPMASEQMVPTPPAGYVDKPTEVIKLQSDRVEEHIYSALSAINMEFLKETPLNQSGTAKEVDRDSLNTFIHAVAEDIVSILDSVIYFIGEYRYKLIVPDNETRWAMLPYINVPENYDILSANYLMTELTTAQNSKLSPAVLNALQLEYANKKFSADPSIRDRLALMIELDPLAGVDEADKSMRLQQGGITKLNYIISCNIQDFIDRAFEEKGDSFADLKTSEQKIIIRAYASEQLAAASPARQILQDSIGN